MARQLLACAVAVGARLGLAGGDDRGCLGDVRLAGQIPAG
jgi:hypothetical protein